MSHSIIEKLSKVGVGRSVGVVLHLVVVLLKDEDGAFLDHPLHLLKQGFVGQPPAVDPKHQLPAQYYIT